MAILDINKIQNTLQSAKYSTIQSNIDTSDTDNTTSNQFGLAIVNAKQITNADFFETLLNENQSFKDSRIGLENKFIIYKPKSTQPITDIGEYVTEDNNQNHTGIYFCDDQKNIYRLSPDYRFNELVTQSILSICEKTNEFTTKINDLQNQINELKGIVESLQQEPEEQIEEQSEEQEPQESNENTIDEE